MSYNNSQSSPSSPSSPSRLSRSGSSSKRPAKAKQRRSSAKTATTAKTARLYKTVSSKTTKSAKSADALAKNHTYSFVDFPEFRPSLSPRDIFKLGSFGGTYWRPIKSRVTNMTYRNVHMRYPKSWFSDLPLQSLVRPWSDYDVHVNKYKVKVGTTLEYWEEKKWISPSHPYGWVHWYCDFFMGKRCDDDARQVTRWVKTAGPNSRFRKRLLNLIRDNPHQASSISPKIRQTLQHWAVVVKVV